MKKLFAIIAICALSCCLGSALGADQTASAPNAADQAKTLKEFTLSADMDGITLYFVLVNNKTLDTLFSGTGKYAIRARANASTMFFVKGVPDKDIDFNPEFTFEQNGKTIEATTSSIKNLKAGPVSKGTQVEGLIQLAEKLDLSQPFKIVDSRKASAQFQLSPEALQLLAN
jgi:hypothetical protein